MKLTHQKYQKLFKGFLILAVTFQLGNTDAKPKQPSKQPRVVDSSKRVEDQLRQISSYLEGEQYSFRKRNGIEKVDLKFLQKGIANYTIGNPAADFNRDGQVSVEDIENLSRLYQDSQNLDSLSTVEQKASEDLLSVLLENDLLRYDDGQTQIPSQSLNVQALNANLLNVTVRQVNAIQLQPICLTSLGMAVMADDSGLGDLVSTLGLSACGSEACPAGDLTGTSKGRALIYKNGIVDGYNLTEVCLKDLGEYDPETGVRIASNNGLINGKYSDTYILSIDEYGYAPFDTWSTLADFQVANNDFRLDPNCYDNPTGDQTQCIGTNQREAIQCSAQTHQYYFIDDFRRRFFNPIVNSLGLDDETKKNVMNRQFRPDIDLGVPATLAKPIVRTGEVSFFSPFGAIVGLNPLENRMSITGITRGSYEPVMNLPPLATAFDPGVSGGEYAGLMAFWILGDNTGFPPELGFFGEWQETMVSALNDGTTAWTAYLMDKSPEVYRTFQHTLRLRAGRTGEKACGGTNYACDKGPSVRSVMMFDPDQTTRDSVFPFEVPVYSDGTPFDEVDGPVGVDLAAMYIAAIFYDISNEAGLGDVKSNKLYWRTLYTINDSYHLNMNQYGEKIMQAVHFLWSDGNGSSRYENDVADVLTSRGIYVNRGNGDRDGDGDIDFRDNLPTSIGDYSAGTLEKNSSNRFGSSNPDSQPSIRFYGNVSTYDNKYTHPEPASYMSYQLYKHSKYGPCDELRLTDGTFTNGIYNNDGSFYSALTGRDLGNKVILAPGNNIRWQRYRKRCENEAEGYYAEDVRPFGFRAIQATTSGFSIRTQSIAERLNFKRYQISIVDPSVATLGESTYSVEYTNYQGNLQTAELSDSTKTYSFWAKKDEPFSLNIIRNRGVGDSVEFRERGNDFDRDNGNAFVLDLVNN